MKVITDILVSLSRRPRSVSALRITRSLAKHMSPLTIIDGGANVGQFARAAAIQFPEASIYSFEPLPEAAAEFRRNMADCRRVELTQSALGSNSGQLEFYPNSQNQTSSALRMEAGRAAATGGKTQFVELPPISVEVTTLDDFAKKTTMASPILLKLDLQGFEMEALKGAEELLERVDFVLLETVFSHLYKGEPLFGDLFDFLRERGFSFLGPVNFNHDADGEIGEMDALFSKQK